MLEGRVKLSFDINEGKGELMNLIFIIYMEGQYFGDNDILTKERKFGRDANAIADSKCQILVITRKEVLHILKNFKEIKKEIKMVARERRLHHKEAKAIAKERYMQKKSTMNKQKEVTTEGTAQEGEANHT